MAFLIMPIEVGGKGPWCWDKTNKVTGWWEKWENTTSPDTDGEATHPTDFKQTWSFSFSSATTGEHSIYVGLLCYNDYDIDVTNTTGFENFQIKLDVYDNTDLANPVNILDVTPTTSPTTNSVTADASGFGVCGGYLRLWTDVGSGGVGAGTVTMTITAVSM